jgi:hypothetical protein
MAKLHTSVAQMHTENIDAEKKADTLRGQLYDEATEAEDEYNENRNYRLYDQ